MKSYKLLDEILDACAEYVDIPPEDLRTRRRDRISVDARRVAVNLFKKLRPHSTLSTIGSMIGRDHSLIVYLLANHDSLIETDDTYKDFYDCMYMVFENRKDVNETSPLEDLLNKHKKLKTEYENLRQEYLTMESNYKKIKQLTNY
jgi:hypothetical protein